MRYQNYIPLLVCLIISGQIMAHLPAKTSKPVAAQTRSACAASTSQIDQDINNVRARLLGGGDCWWNLSSGSYIVPKADPSKGEKEVSAIFAAGIWIGGVDPAGNLKMACQDYRQSGQADFWPGPLDPQSGTTDPQTCTNWDKHFRVTGEEIRLHLRQIADGDNDPENIPAGVKGWPARGNPYFTGMHQFALPANQGLASFFDQDGDGQYDPSKGDYPSIEVYGCPPDRYPAEMIFWIFNDEGSGADHLRTGGKSIHMEVQVQAFGYQTDNELNDMTFQRYKIINRASESIDSTFFAMWVDPDLGCPYDDFIGCDSTNSLMYVYNQDAVDGVNDCNCYNGVDEIPGYCDNIPMIGVDFFRGPTRSVSYYNWATGDLKDTLQQLGMTKFMYYSGNSSCVPIPTMTDPELPTEYYNYLTGRWRDGTPLTSGGMGYNIASTEWANFAFPGAPNDPDAWSLCHLGPNSFCDPRTLQAAGPFLLKPGAVNELIIGVPFVSSVPHPCPDLEYLLRADRLAQAIFDHCFHMDGPDAPDVNWIELHQQAIAILSNESVGKNNKNEGFRQLDFFAPDSIRKSTDPDIRKLAEYRFEGYKIFQLIRPDVHQEDFDDPDLARLVYQSDKKNGIGKIFNWIPATDPAAPNDPRKKVYFPVEKVAGADEGIRHTFSITEDMFSTANVRTLINHKKYYYAVVAYAHNNFGDFIQNGPHLGGQPTSYKEGGRVQIQTIIPRPVVDQQLQASYGDGVIVTRLEGAGAGGRFLEVDAAEREAMLQPDFAGEVTYLPGKSPLNIIIFNPFTVKDGEFELEMVDNNPDDAVLAPTARWVLREKDTNGNLIDVGSSQSDISELNEQVFEDYGISVSIVQTPETGDLTPSKTDPAIPPTGPANGAIGARISYEKNNPWLSGLPDQESGIFNYIRTGKAEKDHFLDPEQQLGHMGDGFFVPFPLVSGALPDGPLTNPQARMMTPAWTGKIGSTFYHDVTMGLSTPASPDVSYDLIRQLPNVDIVLTPDPSQWSRCIVIETASEYYTGNMSGVVKDSTLTTESGPGRIRQSFDLRYGLSVGKTDQNGDGLPDPDQETEPEWLPDPTPNNPAQVRPNPIKGAPLRGMGWFPGYAVDVETGQRLNLFFGENSCYNNSLNPGYTGRDMLWNPTAQLLKTSATTGDMGDLVMGGQHWVYVTRTPYDECALLRSKLNPDYWSSTLKNFRKTDILPDIAWSGMLTLAPDASLRPLQNGLIPGETVVQLRVENPFQVKKNTGNGHPKYRIRIAGKTAQPLNAVQVASALDSIKVVPNPYFSASVYESAPDSRVVKITNLPARCVVTIYSLDGVFIRQFKRNETYQAYQQISPSLDWDMTGMYGKLVPSGAYLIHVNAYEQGERVLKWMGVVR